ncbi:hypothetical protein COT75_04775 [Candidatus Beckwithbacteria bacterium CG10_big_fil_rev_8_21_14_0_10_34_10]|uniref:N-acetyltransferase domain-containing protein n=1 Tax=Candidatus Beckwithbacteria bacterium CG10_big_fil_rev_8_21_14_0_10_34_10 TaxID=1974495 RepID=A0A2H0WA17_9BACT|nr:MAG: hypothetical protein COT75_04775 [Candidatus Beckwithbacteria bacterium CG10_big_fil_rev_8_21_14_0_10_34_10]
MIIGKEQSLWNSILSPNEFVPGTFQKLGVKKEDKPDFSSLSGIVFRTSNWKGEWLGNLFPDLDIPKVVFPPEWQEDNHKGYLPPGKRAALKAVDNKNDLRQAVDSLRPSQGVVVGLSTDIDLISNKGIELRKSPPDASYADIEAIMNRELGGEDFTTFKARAAIGFFGKDNRNVDDIGFGLSLVAELSFSVAQLSPQEIEFYIHGLKGRDNNCPGYLKEIFDSIDQAFILDESEKQRIKEGFPLKRLKMTNLSCFWPHPLLQAKIKAIDGVSKEGNRQVFERNLRQLYLTLLGAPVEAREGLEQYLFFRNNQTSSESSLYTDLPGRWGQMIKLKDGSFVTAQRIVPGNYESVSQMVCDNFSRSDNFRDLRNNNSQAVKAYKRANSSDGVKDTCNHEKNILCLVCQNKLGEPVGYRVIREERHPHPENDSLVAHGKRLHVAREVKGLGLGRQLMRISEEMAKELGYQTMVVQPSGSSKGYFENLGFSRVFSHSQKNGVLANQGISVEMVLMEKSL